MEKQDDDLLKTIERLHRIEDAAYGFVVTSAMELRTPVIAIASMVEILHIYESKSTDEKRDELILSIRDHVQILQQLLDDMVESSMVLGGWFDLEFQEVNIKQLFTRVESVVETKRWGDFYPEIKYKVPDALPTVRVDSLRIEQMLIEILLTVTRIVRECEGGEIVISAGCDSEWFEIEVADNGVGLPEYFINKPSDLSRTSEPIVEKHKGLMELKDRDEGGWVLNIKLPAG